jgi:hypothetical protein
VLDGQLGVSRSPAGADGLELEWFGVRVLVPSAQQRSLDDEVTVPTAALLRALGVTISHRQGTLQLQLPPAELLSIRSRDQGLGLRRVVLDLAAPALVRSGDGRLQLAIRSSPEQQRQLQTLGLEPSDTQGWLSLRAGEARRLSLASPWRLVLDLPLGEPPNAAQPPRPQGDPRLQALQAQGLQLQRQILRSGDQQLLVNSVQLDPRLPVIPVRALKNAGSEAFNERQREVAAAVDRGEMDLAAGQLAIEHYWAGALRRAVVDGDVEGGSLRAGQSVGMVTSVQPVAEIIAELTTDAEAALSRRTVREAAA